MRSIYILLWAAVLPMAAQIPSADWPTYTRDLAGTKYSPLAQITPDNITKLAPAWTFALKAVAVRADTAADPFAVPGANVGTTSAATPIVVNGVMYLPAGRRVVALDPTNGSEIWSYSLPSGLASQR